MPYTVLIGKIGLQLLYIRNQYFTNTLCSVNSDDFHSIQDCNFTCINIEDFRTHKNSKKHTKPTIQCPDCDKAYTERGQYLAHVKSHDPTKQKYQCEICGKKFHQNSLLTVSSCFHVLKVW